MHHPIIGLGCLIVGLLKGRQLLPVLLVGMVAIGICSGLRERHQELHPVSPRGEVRVQPASWRVYGDYASYTGTASNGVPVSGAVSITKGQAKTIGALANPVVLQWTKSQRIAAAHNLGEFNYASYAWQQNHQAYTIDSGDFVIQKRVPHSLWDWFAQLRLAVVRRISRLPDRVAAYAQALLLGVMNTDMADMRETFSKLGILHLFSVSGLHVFALVGMLYGLGRRIRVTAEAVDTLLLVLLPVVLCVIPMSAGLLRAILMRELQVVATKLKLPLSTLDCLLVILIVNLLYRPQLLCGLGGQMTYLLTFVLIVSEQKENFRQCFDMACVSAAPVVYSVYGLHLLTFIFNYLLMPIFEVVLMPLLLILVVWPGCPLALPLNDGLRLLDALLMWLARLPGFLPVGHLAACLAIALTLTTLEWLARHRKWPLLLALTLSCAMVLWRPHPRLTQFAMAQGEATLIETAWRGHAVLVNTGGSPFKAGTKQAERIIAAYARYRGITRLDAIVLGATSRPYAGDVGALSHVLPSRLIVVPPVSKLPVLVRQAAASSGAQLLTLNNQLPLQFGQTKITLQAVSASKASSILVEAKLNQKRILLNSATTVKSALPFLAGHYAILKLGSQGSSVATSKRLLTQMRPKQAIVTPGVQNFQALLNTTTISALSQAGIPLTRTDQVGMIWFEDDQLHTYNEG
ncbi:ComEC/Rec2 family competence protein [Lacticaseibacillus pabuli]|uniref:ComEC/Rec2 family competence protein n=1 Tax=Lacticaseibacillus pabuli TaxID=3025672 RepID=A0ABY7WN61_9LACO|nr:ComEC/Rec2 family competence protein [Lacticaseibacillus sp. KACC 23028]WDF81630.1 ComEC/Rec2 family competence protein [Lacticaseibacillus sp. KACC 23028]